MKKKFIAKIEDSFVVVVVVLFVVVQYYKLFCAIKLDSYAKMKFCGQSIYIYDTIMFLILKLKRVCHQIISNEAKYNIMLIGLEMLSVNDGMTVIKQFQAKRATKQNNQHFNYFLSLCEFTMLKTNFVLYNLLCICHNL